MKPGQDPLVVRRALIGRWATAAKRAGYACIAVATVAFVIALVAGLPGWAVTVTIAGLVAAAVVLPPAIIVSYGVAKATREDPGAPG
ncbi:MAG: hypothetical protein QOG64_2110 [Acidimicrobiaceae bacterium]|nr:hypothetical protein [Acidimicrobiaceae bacterium]